MDCYSACPCVPCPCRPKVRICMDQTAEQERQLRNMQMELENNSRQLAAAVADRDNAAMENRRLQDDLAAVTCEVRAIQRELEVSRAESHDLKRQLQTYVSEVRRAEELLNRKENERTEMLNHFRSLSLEATVLENNNHSLESEAAEARGALQSARDRLIDLERQLADKDCLIRGYEAQITELTQNVASLETQIRQQLELRGTAETDLNAVRDLCVQLDQQKEALKKEIIDKDSIIAQYEAKLSRFKAENNAVHDQKSRDHVTIDRLQMLLDQARRESVDCQKNNQELVNEIDRMKQRINDLQNKLSSESAELKRCQNQAVEYSNQVAELRRKVTDERFNRARTEEEHRRSYPYSDQMHMSGEPAPTSRVSPSTRNFTPQELGTNIRSGDGEPSDTTWDLTAVTKDSDLGHGESMAKSGYIVHAQEEEPRGTASRKKFLPCLKTCCNEDNVDQCPASKCDKSVSTDGEKTRRKKTQTETGLKPQVVDAEVSVPTVTDASVSNHQLSNSHLEISQVREVLQTPEVPRVPDRLEQIENRIANEIQRQASERHPATPAVPRGRKKNNLVPVEPQPGASEIPRKRGRPRKDKDDCGCTIEIQLPKCRVQVPPEQPEPVENEESFQTDVPNESLNRTFDQVNDLTRSIQERLNSINFSTDDSQPEGARSRSRNATIDAEDEPNIVIEESSTSLIIQTGTRLRTPPVPLASVEREIPHRQVPVRPRVRSREIPQVASEPVAPPKPREPSPPRPREVSPPKPRELSPPRRVPAPPRLPAPPRPRIPVPFRSQGLPAPPRPPVPVPPRPAPQKQKKMNKKCDLTHCHTCPMTRPLRQHVQFPRGNLQPVHTSSPVVSSHTLSRPNHRYHLRSHAKTVYTVPIEDGARGRLRTQRREESSSSESEIIRVRRKKSRKISTQSSENLDM